MHHTMVCSMSSPRGNDDTAGGHGTNVMLQSGSLLLCRHQRCLLSRNPDWDTTSGAESPMAQGRSSFKTFPSLLVSSSCDGSCSCTKHPDFSLLTSAVQLYNTALRCSVADAMPPACTELWPSIFCLLCKNRMRSLSAAWAGVTNVHTPLYVQGTLVLYQVNLLRLSLRTSKHVAVWEPQCGMWGMVWCGVVGWGAV